MPIGPDEVLAQETLFRHLALFLLVLAIAMPALAPLRWVALAAGVVLIMLASVVVYDPTGLFWAILFVVANLVRIVLDRRGQTRPFSPEERLFHERIVPSLSPRQTLKLLSVGRWHDVAAGTALTREGEPTAELSFISRGEIDIMVGGRKAAECGPGALIGEGGLATGGAATATAVCATPVRYLGFGAERLYGLLDRHTDLRDAVELAVTRSLRDKLHRSNLGHAKPAAAAS